MEKLHSNQIMSYLANDIDMESYSKCDLSNYCIRIYEFLMEKMKRGSPIPFVLNESI